MQTVKDCRLAHRTGYSATCKFFKTASTFSSISCTGISPLKITNANIRKTRIYAENPEERESTEDPARRIQDVDKMLKELNINKSTAKQILKVWKKAGVKDPEDLRRLVVKRGANQSATVAIQLAVDASSALIAWYSGYTLATSRALGPFTLAAEFAVYSLAMYLSINASLDIFSLIALGVATKRYSANSSAFLDAVQSMAGPDSGLEVVDKAKKVIVTVQVLSALDQILDRLKLRAGSDLNKGDFLRDLGAYIVLLRASEKGFDPMKEGLTMADAAEIAAEFAVVDKDDNGLIDSSEFRQLCGRLAPNLSEEESLAAMSVLDTNNDNTIDFNEFVAWWRKHQ